MKINQLKAGSIISYLQMGLSIIIGMLYTPIMIRLLGDSEYGLYNTVASTISILSLLSMGFNSGYIRYYAKYKKNEEYDKINSLNGMFLLIFLIIGAVALACGTFLTLNLELVFDEGLTLKEYEIARVLMALMTVNLAVSFPMSVFANIISAHERYIFLKLLNVIKTVFSPLITLPLLLMGYRSIAMVSVTVAISLFVDGCYLFYVLVKLKCKFVFHNFEKGLFKGLFVFTFFIALNSIVDQVNVNLGKFLLGRYKGTTAVAIYSVGFSLYNYYQMFSVSISGVFAPRIHRIVNTAETEQDKKRELTSLFVKVGRIQYIILSLVATGLIFFGLPFITKFWAGEGYADSYVVALLLILPGTIPLMQNIGIEIQRAQNKHQFRALVYFGMALVNLVSSIFLSQLYGPIGAAIGTAASLLLANGVAMNIYYHKRCNVDVICFWKNILRVSVGLIIPIAFGVSINLFFDFSNLWTLALGIIEYTGVYCISMWFLGMNSYERDLIKKPLVKIYQRCKRG